MHRVVILISFFLHAVSCILCWLQKIWRFALKQVKNHITFVSMCHKGTMLVLITAGPVCSCHVRALLI